MSLMNPAAEPMKTPVLVIWNSRRKYDLMTFIPHSTKWRSIQTSSWILTPSSAPTQRFFHSRQCENYSKDTTLGFLAGARFVIRKVSSFFIEGCRSRAQRRRLQGEDGGTSRCARPRRHRRLVGMTSTDAPKEFVRSDSQKMIAGVCGGVGEYFGIDANLVRVLTVLGTVVSGGTVALIYLAAWMLMPSR